MILLGITSMAFFVYGLYQLCFEEGEESERIESEEEQLVAELDEQSEYSEGEYESDEEYQPPHFTEMTDEEIAELWSSYHLEQKYNEMSSRERLREYLGLAEWKKKVRSRFRQIITSKIYQSDPMDYIRTERSKRDRNEYAIVEDTVLNLLEYYELASSQVKENVKESLN